MSDARQVSTSIATVTGSMVRGFDVPTLLQDVADQVRLCFGAYSAVVVLLDPRSVAGTAALHIVAESSTASMDAQALIETVGPALDSARSGATALVADLSEVDDTRWPEYRRRAIDAGMRGVRAIPIAGFDHPIGSIVIHTEEPWGATQPNQAGQVFADLTALALCSVPRDERSATLDDAIDLVLDGTIVVATAIGMIAQARDLDVTGARRTLTRLARAHGVSPTEHARRILDAQRRYPRDPGAAGVFDPPSLPSPPHIGR